MDKNMDKNMDDINAENAKEVDVVDSNEPIAENEELDAMGIDKTTETPVENSLPPGFWPASSEESQVFKSVDRKWEDEAVFRYQQLRDTREDKEKTLLALRQEDILAWATVFREIGRSQESMVALLNESWKQCLISQESGRGTHFATSLQKAFFHGIRTLANKNNKQKLLEKLVASEPKIKSLEEESTLISDYLSLVDTINSLVGELYAIREPTIKVWARRYHYLSTGEEEMLAELRLVWMRCVNDYEYEAKERVVSTFRGHHVHDSKGNVKKRLKTTTFNTYKFSSFRNFIVNQIKRKYKCQKRIDENKVPYEQTMMSLDHQYDDQDGEGTSLHDVVAAPVRYEGRSLSADILIDRIAGNDTDIRAALEKVVYDPHVKSLESACRLRSGIIEVDEVDRDFIYSTQATKDEAWKPLVAKLIAKAGLHRGNFIVVGAQVWPTCIAYEIKVKDTRLLQRTKKAIRTAKLEKEMGLK